MPNGKSLAELKNLYKKKGFNVHNLSEFVNIPAELERASKAELPSIRVTPPNIGTPTLTRKKLKRELPNWEKSFLNKRLLAGIESNYNNIPYEFQNLAGRNRSSTATSDPRSRTGSPSQGGKRKTRKRKTMRRRKH